MGGVPGGTALSCSQFWLFVCFFGPSAAETGSAPSHGCQSQLGSLTCSGRNDRAESIFLHDLNPSP